MHPATLRRLLLAVCALLGLLGARAPVRADDPNTTESKVTKANYEKLKTGMTAEEVEAILGPGKSITAEEFGQPRTRVQARIVAKIAAGAKALQWVDGRKRIVVVFDQGGKVTATSGRNLD